MVGTSRELLEAIPPWTLMLCFPRRVHVGMRNEYITQMMLQMLDLQRMTPQYIDYSEVKLTVICCTSPWVLNFSYFRSTVVSSCRCRPFWDNCTEWPPNELEHYQVKGTPYMHVSISVYFSYHFCRSPSLGVSLYCSCLCLFFICNLCYWYVLCIIQPPQYQI